MAYTILGVAPILSQRSRQWQGIGDIKLDTSGKRSGAERLYNKVLLSLMLHQDSQVQIVESNYYYNKKKLQNTAKKLIREQLEFENTV